MSQNVRQKLKEIGSKLEKTPQSKGSLLKLLKQAATCLSEIDQSPPKSLLGSMQACINALAKDGILKYEDTDVKLLVAACISEIMRITAPELPYGDDVLRDVFGLIVEAFRGLHEKDSPSFQRRASILETLAKYRSCVVMLDLECSDLVKEVFTTFFSVASNHHPEAVFMSMETILILLIDESEDVQEGLLVTLLGALGQREEDTSLAGQRLAKKVIERCAGKLEPFINQCLISAISKSTSFQTIGFDHYDAIYEIYCCAPQILHGLIPRMIQELSVDQLDVRLKTVNLIGRMFAFPGNAMTEIFQPLFSELLKKLTDRVVKVRISVVEQLRACLLSHLSGPEASHIISVLSDRLSDNDEHVREHVVAAICDVIKGASECAPVETLKLVTERLQDKSTKVKRYTLERLVELYRLQCLKCSDIHHNEYKWVPGKILRCFYDNDLRYEAMEILLSDSLISTDIQVKDYVKHWIAAFSEFEKVETKAFEQALLQKKRLQEELQSYLILRKKSQDSDTADITKRSLGCIRAMSRSFKDPSKAEENFHLLEQLNNDNVWNILTNLLDYNTGTVQALTAREDLLKIIGREHPLFDFLGTLSIKCSCTLFNKEHVKEMLDELLLHKSARDEKLVSSCLNLLVILASFFPLIFRGVEEHLVLLLKDDDETIKEGIVHILAKAGGSIRDQLPMLAGSVDTLLERLCLEGTRRQAKYAVQALAAITIDDGLKSLSLLYKHLVDMLGKRAHLPAILQSLGCIAQIAVPIFETREEEIVGFISTQIMDNSIEGSISKTDWNEKSEQCLLKIFAIKTLVKSYLPVKDSSVRSGIEILLEMLKGILSFGEVSPGVESSAVDKAHLRLASAKAILRLAKVWDHKIPIDVFHLTVRVSQDMYPEARACFLSKVHQYAKERLVDAKYAIALPLGIAETDEHEYKAYKQHLIEIIEMLYREAKSRQLYASGQNLPSDYPEYILAYLVHALAHSEAFPNLDESPNAEPFVPIYRKIHNFLSVLFHQDEGCKLETASSDIRDKVCAIVSIFQSIKNAEDVVDLSKSKNSHILCDLGLTIMKHLCGGHLDTDSPYFIPLPSVLYNSVGKSKVDDNNMINGELLLPWLARDDLFLHFQSLNLENGAKVKSGVIKDHKRLKHQGNDDAELPLVKMMKMLKSTKSKKKNATTHPASGGIKRQEDELDILSMVKEIESDNLYGHKSLNVGDFAATSTLLQTEAQSNKSISDNGLSQSQKTIKSTHECDSNHKRKFSDGKSLIRIDSATPKKKKKSSRGSDSSESGDELEQDFSFGKARIGPTNNTLLITPVVETEKTVSSRAKRKSTSTLKDDIYVYEDTKHEKKKMATSSDDKLSKTKQNVRSMEKSKTKGVPGLQKCSSKRSGKGDEELIGCRIKVWWPMDKRFYEGFVQSYDVKKKKHKILYDDGDEEILVLAKEKWEMVGDVANTSTSPQSLSPRAATTHEKPSGSITTKKSHVSGGNKKTAFKKKLKSPNSSAKRKIPKSRVAPLSNHDEDAASQHSDEEDGSSINHDDVKDAEVVPPAENVTDEPQTANQDSVLEEDEVDATEDLTVRQKNSRE